MQNDQEICSSLIASFPRPNSIPGQALDATLRAAIAVQIGCPADLSRAGGNPVDNKIPYKELIYRLDSRLRGNDEKDDVSWFRLGRVRSIMLRDIKSQPALCMPQSVIPDNGSTPERTWYEKS